MRRFGVAATTALHRRLVEHLVRDDRAEDLAFVLWRPSTGVERLTAILVDIVLPEPGERHLHGNVSFESRYFLRACAEAQRRGAGIALVHSHPGARTWQGLSSDDFAAESRHAAQTLALTGHALVGLTMAGATTDISARIWQRTGNRLWEPHWAESVRVVGEQMRVSLPPGQPRFSGRRQRRTIDSWGPQTQQVLASLRVAVVGAGSVGSQIVEALARTGFGDLLILDYDSVEPHNLDRILNATRADARQLRAKAEVAASAARAHATHPDIQVRWSDYSAVESQGIEMLKDFDVIFSCVDRPAGRASLNALAYAHLIPVVDGGVLVSPREKGLRGAEWRAHVASPGRRCLECLGQYDPGLVQADRDGLLDDPTYLVQLPDDHVLKRNENVYAFSAATASEQILAALRMIVAPAGLSDVGAQTFHFATGTVDFDERGCNEGCLYGAIAAQGESSGRPVGHRHLPAELARQARPPRLGTPLSVDILDRARVRVSRLIRRRRV